MGKQNHEVVNGTCGCCGTEGTVYECVSHQMADFEPGDLRCVDCWEAGCPNGGPCQS